jgi:hypothetical protein
VVMRKSESVVVGGIQTETGAGQGQREGERERGREGERERGREGERERGREGERADLNSCLQHMQMSLQPSNSPLQRFVALLIHCGTNHRHAHGHVPSCEDGLDPCPPPLIHHRAWEGYTRRARGAAASSDVMRGRSGWRGRVTELPVRVTSGGIHMPGVSTYQCWASGFRRE